MDEQQTVSKRVIDHRKAAIHGLPPVVALLFGWLMFHNSAPADSDRDLVLNVSTAIDRGVDYWQRATMPQWRAPYVVLIDHDHGEVTPCGQADDRSGPFYCPVNERIYVDVQFLRAIRGDLARAYVTAHELGHHVQKIRGELDGRPSVSIELQADCYAGMWMHDEQVRGHLASTDTAAAIEEARAVGDDRICPACSPEMWTHGSSLQRAKALSDGLAGDCSAWRR